MFAVADSILSLVLCTFNFLVRSLNEENHLLFSLTCPSTANARYEQVPQCQLSRLQDKTERRGMSYYIPKEPTCIDLRISSF